jgi:hypothetical protein
MLGESLAAPPISNMRCIHFNSFGSDNKYKKLSGYICPFGSGWYVFPQLHEIDQYVVKRQWKPKIYPKIATSEN